MRSHSGLCADEEASSPKKRQNRDSSRESQKRFKRDADAPGYITAEEVREQGERQGLSPLFSLKRTISEVSLGQMKASISFSSIFDTLSDTKIEGQRMPDEWQALHMEEDFPGFFIDDV